LPNRNVGNFVVTETKRQIVAAGKACVRALPIPRAAPDGSDDSKKNGRQLRYHPIVKIRTLLSKVLCSGYPFFISACRDIFLVFPHSTIHLFYQRYRAECHRKGALIAAHFVKNPIRTQAIPGVNQCDMRIVFPNRFALPSQNDPSKRVK
jgi:hypothetical protein